MKHLISRNHEADQSMVAPEAIPKEIVKEAAKAGSENRGRLPVPDSFPAIEALVSSAASIDCSFDEQDIRNIREKKKPRETAEMIAKQLAPAIEMAHRCLISPDSYQPLDQTEMSRVCPLESYCHETNERIVWSGENGQELQERHFVRTDEHDRPVVYIIGEKLSLSPRTSIEFYAWIYAPNSSDYTPIRGLHSEFAPALNDRHHQAVTFYTLEDGFKLENPKDLYWLHNHNNFSIQTSFNLRILDGYYTRYATFCQNNADSPGRRKQMGIQPCGSHYVFSMFEDQNHADGPYKVNYGFDVVKEWGEAWSYKNHDSLRLASQSPL